MPKRKWPEIKSQYKVNKSTYEVVYIDNFVDPKQLGEWRQDPPQVVLKSGQTEKEIFASVIHELIHAADDEYELKLTHNQVYGLEKALIKFLMQNGFV